MLAFRPGDASPTGTDRPASHTPAPVPAPRQAPARTEQRDATVPPATVPPTRSSAESPPAAVAPPQPAAVPSDANGLPVWEALIAQAGLRGPLGLLAQNAVLRERDGQTLVLGLQPVHMHLAVEPMVSQMEERIGQALGERIRLRFVGHSADAAVATPAARAAQARDMAQSAAEQAIEGDPLVQSLKRDFGAKVVPQSIKPIS